MKLNVKKATASFICHVFVRDNTSTAGAGLTGLDNTKVVLYYMRAGASTAVAVTLDASSGVTLGTYKPTDNSHGAIKEVDATDMPGVYELHLANNALATGANQVLFLLTDAGSNHVMPLAVEIQLVGYDPTAANLSVVLADADHGGAAATLALHHIVIASSGGQPAVEISAVADAIYALSTASCGLNLESNGGLPAMNLNANGDVGLQVQGPNGAIFLAGNGQIINHQTPANQTAVAKVGLASNGLDAVVVETGMNARQSLAIAVAAVAGVLSGANTTTVSIAAAGVPATNRVSATVDQYGNRSAVNLTLPA
jgi:hypothetical protein